MKNFAFFFLISIIFFWSCNKDDGIADIEEFIECHEELGLDSLAIENSLIGTWAWDFSNCALNQDQDYSGLTIEFDSSKNLTLNRNDGQTQTSNWKLVRSESTFWIETAPYVSETEGALSFCDDSVLFSNTIVDGCNIYYKRE